MANRHAAAARRQERTGKWLGSSRSALAGIGIRVSVAAVAFGCGARAMVDGSADEDVAFGTGGSGSSGASGDRAGGSGGGSASPSPVEPGPLDLSGVALPECEPGFSPSSAGSRECTYVFRGNCYEEQLMACACACQGLADSNCLSDGFLNPDEPQQVSCFPR